MTTRDSLTTGYAMTREEAREFVENYCRTVWTPNHCIDEPHEDAVERLMDINRDTLDWSGEPLLTPEGATTAAGWGLWIAMLGCNDDDCMESVFGCEHALGMQQDCLDAILYDEMISLGLTPTADG